MDNLKLSLKKHFGFNEFKNHQESVIKNLLEGNDSFVIMPTGGGKSLCYQLPALIMDGTAIVISPLIALMKNQVDLLRASSTDHSIAHVLNSTLTKQQVSNVKEDVINNKTKLLYIAPETLSKIETIDFLKTIKISFLAIDEAHCISEWGHDFRPEYRKIREIIELIDTELKIIALTATATPKVQDDIVKNLKINNFSILPGSESKLLKGLELGCAGIITATCNVTSALSRKVYEDFFNKKEQTVNQKLCDVRSAFEKYNLISGLHTFYSKNDLIYKNVLPPLSILNSNEEKELIDNLEKLNFSTKPIMAA